MAQPLDQLIPEVLHVICQHLHDDKRSLFALRLTCHKLDDIVSCHAFQLLPFYLHQDDFTMLRHLAAHPIISKNVKSLVYHAEALNAQPRSLESFVADVLSMDRAYGLVAHIESLPNPSQYRQSEFKPEPIRYGEGQLQQWHDIYMTCHSQQTHIYNAKLDFELFRDIIPQFTSLSAITVSAKDWFTDVDNDGQSGMAKTGKTPFDKVLERYGWARKYVTPTSLRQIDSLLLGPTPTSNLRILRLGEVDWSFLSSHLNDSHKLDRLRTVCCKLREFHLAIDTVLDEESGQFQGMHAEECRVAVRQGNLRKLVGSMPELEKLGVSFTFHGLNRNAGGHRNIYAASLSDLIPKDMQWEKMRSFRLMEIEGTRQEFEALFRRHRETLEYVFIDGVRLLRSSWVVFLSQLKSLFEDARAMEDFVLSGDLYGQTEIAEDNNDSEDESSAEYFDLGKPELFFDDSLAVEIFEKYVLHGVGDNPFLNYRGPPSDPR